MSKVKCKVVGPCAISGVRKPGTVELDTNKVHVDALVAAGHVEIVTAPEKKTVEK